VQIFRELGFDDLCTIIETSTLKYGCRAKEYKVEVPVEVNRVVYPSRLSQLEFRRDPRNGIIKAISYHCDLSNKTGPKETIIQKVLPCKDIIVVIHIHTSGFI